MSEEKEILSRCSNLRSLNRVEKVLFIFESSHMTKCGNAWHHLCLTLIQGWSGKKRLQIGKRKLRWVTMDNSSCVYSSFFFMTNADKRLVERNISDSRNISIGYLYEFIQQDTVSDRWVKAKSAENSICRTRVEQEKIIDYLCGLIPTLTAFSSPLHESFYHNEWTRKWRYQAILDDDRTRDRRKREKSFQYYPTAFMLICKLVIKIEHFVSTLVISW